MKDSRSALVLWAGSPVGGRLVKRLKREGFWVRGVNLKFDPYCDSSSDDFLKLDLRDESACNLSDMGAAGYIFTGEHHANVMHNSTTIDFSVLDG
jgi:GDP-D-mannose 3', 5'-epimerase